MWLLKQVNVDNSLVDKSIKDIYGTQNDNSGGSKYAIPEIGQRSNECNFSINVQFITLEWSLNKFPIWNCNKTI